MDMESVVSPKPVPQPLDTFRILSTYTLLIMAILNVWRADLACVLRLWEFSSCYVASISWCWWATVVPLFPLFSIETQWPMDPFLLPKWETQWAVDHFLFPKEEVIFLPGFQLRTHLPIEIHIYLFPQPHRHKFSSTSELIQPLVFCLPHKGK